MRFELQLKEIELHNFRLFEHVKVAFDDKLTVLISENGAGKTALLEGIAKALRVVTEQIAHDETNLNNKGIYRLEDIKNEKAASTTEILLLSKLQSNVLPNSDTTLGWQLRFNRRSVVVNVVQTGTYLADITHQIDKALNSQQPISLPVLVYYPCERMMTDSKNGKDETYGMTMFNAYDHALDGFSLDYKRFLAWYDWQERIERRSKNNRVLDIVRQSILDILNDDDDTAFSTIDIDPSEFNNPKLIIQKGDDKVEVNQLSSGEKSLLMLVSNLAYRMALLNPNSKDPLKEGQGIVLIDEIDLHLHPRWQRVVIPKLRHIFPEIQWIITTHSPQVLMNVKRENVKVINHGKIEDAPFVEGRDANALSLDVFGLSKRLPKYEAMLDKIHDLIDNGEEKQAQIEIESLKQIWGNDDLDMHRAESFLEML